MYILQPYLISFFFSKSSNTTDVTRHLNMGVQAYNVFILFADILMLLCKWVYNTIEGVTRVVVPVEEADVSNEIVLVNSFHNFCVGFV